MIRTTIMLEPNGDASRAKELAEITIANITPDGSGRLSSDYAWRIRLTHFNNNMITDYGTLVDSRNDDAVSLVWEVISEWKSGREFPIDNHGHPVKLLSDHVKFWKKADPK